jgi:hypothetical protein
MVSVVTEENLCSVVTDLCIVLLKTMDGCDLCIVLLKTIDGSYALCIGFSLNIALVSNGES